MPSDIMDQRHISSLYRPSVPSSFFTEEARFSSEKHHGFWKTASVPDSRGLETMSFMSGGKTVSSSPLEKICPTGRKFVDCLELPHNLFKDPKRNILHNFDPHLMEAQGAANCWRAPEQDVGSLCGQPASLSAENKRVALNGAHYENGLFSSSLLDMFNNTLRLTSSDAFVNQAVNANQPNFVEDEVFASLEEIEAQTIGDLLPDDDDLLSGAIHDPRYVAQSNKADVEDDLFCSVGGMELESSDNFSCKKEYDYGGAFSVRGMGLSNLPANNLPHGEQPSRTLFVRNIDGNMEDMELRGFFEQYGDIRTLNTSSRRHGFIMVSYYDIRAAENAVRVLQTKSIRGQKLDIQFYISKDNPSEKDINEGVLLVTNLESSISNDDLLHIFGIHGEIKEICEIPHHKYHKLIEFYDVRAAETALSALNRCDIVGKRIKVEPCGLRDTGFGSMRYILSVNLEEEESSKCGPEGCSQKLPSECFVPSGLMTYGANTSSGLHKLSSPARVAMVGNHGNQSELSHSLGQINLGYQSMPTFPRDGAINGVPFNSMAVNVSSSPTMGVDNRNTQRGGSGVRNSHSFEHNEAVFNVSGYGSCPLKSHGYIWNNSNAHHPHHPGSIMWQDWPQFMNNIPTQTPQMHGLARGPSHIPNPVLSHQHVGSAPSLDPMLWNQKHSLSGDATSFHPSSLGSLGYSSCSPVHSLELSSHNIYLHANGACLDPSIASVHVAVPSPQQRSHIFRGRNNVNPTPNSHDAHDRIRSRRSDLSTNQADSRKQYLLDIDCIIRGEDLRTTLMIKNIPNKYTSKLLLATIDEQHKGTYDFIYLPIDFKNKCNVGYAFINMTDPQHIIPFYQAFNGKKWEKFNSEKVAYLAYARIQGKSALIAHFQNSSLMNEDKRCRPILFHSDGPNAGDQEPFPVGVNIRSRRSRTNTENHQGSPSGSSSGDESSSATGSSSGSGKDL